MFCINCLHARFYVCLKKASLKKQYKIILNYIIGPVLFLVLIYSIYSKIKNQPDLPDKLSVIRSSFSMENAWIIAALFLLMLLNWGIESRKWQMLVKPVQAISFFTAFKAILSGLSLSLFIPNGIGEYFGRIVYMNEGNRLRSVSLTIIGSISQLIITIGCGLAALLYLRNTSWRDAQQIQGLDIFWVNSIVSMIAMGLAVLLVVYYKMGWIVNLLDKVPFFHKYRYMTEHVEEFHPKELTRILLLSALRFMVFVVQYVLMLHLFKVELGLPDAVGTTCVLFLVLAIIPTIPLADIGIRGEAGLQLFGLLTANTVGIIVTTFGIWFLNLILPSVAGSLFIAGIKIFKKQKGK